MTPSKARDVLIQHNSWRTDDTGTIAMPESRMITEALSVAIEALEAAPKISADELKSEFAKQMREFHVHYKIQAVEDALKGALDMSRVDHYLDCMEGQSNRALGILLNKLQPAPVCHYLPEVPEDGEAVIGYCEQLKRGTTHLFKDGKWYDLEMIEVPQELYAWTRIPPKPPVKPTEGEHP